MNERAFHCDVCDLDDHDTLGHGDDPVRLPWWWTPESRDAYLAALVAQARSDALAPVLAFADQWHHPDHGGSCWGCAIMRAAASSHPTGNQP